MPLQIRLEDDARKSWRILLLNAQHHYPYFERQDLKSLVPKLPRDNVNLDAEIPDCAFEFGVPKGTAPASDGPPQSSLRPTSRWPQSRSRSAAVARCRKSRRRRCSQSRRLWMRLACADRRLPAARRVAERHAVCRRPLRTWRSRSTLRFGFPDSRARSQPAGLPSAWSNGSRLSSAVSTYPSAPIARLEAPSIEARSTNHRKEPECASASHDWPAGKRRAKVVSGRLSPRNAVVVVDLAAVVVGVLGHASLRIARSLFELLLLERYDVAFETGVVLQHAPRDRVAIRAYAEKATELKRRIAHLARELVDD